MPAFATGLNLGKPKPSLESRLAGQKRKKTLFDDESDTEDAAPESMPGLKTSGLSKSGLKSKASTPSQQLDRFTNLSALHESKKRAAEAEKIDQSVYDYDDAYDTFSAASKPKNPTISSAPSVPKYMVSLLESAEIRKRDQLRAKERMLQKEREAEGDEYADKEKFVTGAYKQQQEEIRRLEAEEAKREAEEEKKRLKGGGMRGFYQSVLQREDQKHDEIAKAAEEKAALGPQTDDTDSKTKSEAQIAAELNSKGARIALNDEGAVVDKRDLLSAGLNVAAKPKSSATDTDKAKSTWQKPTDWSQTSAGKSSKEAMRERQTRMLTQQLEEMAQKQAEEEQKERRQAEEKVKSKVTDDKVMSAKERYLARKKQREEEANAGNGSG